LYEKRVSYADSLEARVDMRRNLSRVLEDECKDPARAQGVLQQGLLEAPTDGALLDELERLAKITGQLASLRPQRWVKLSKSLGSGAGGSRRFVHPTWPVGRRTTKIVRAPPKLL